MRAKLRVALELSKIGAFLVRIDSELAGKWIRVSDPFPLSFLISSPVSLSLLFWLLFLRRSRDLLHFQTPGCPGVVALLLLKL